MKPPIPCLICAVLSMVLNQSLAQSIISGPILNPANGHTYYLLERSSWDTAETAAQAIGGHLVSINNDAEQQWVFSTFGTLGGFNKSLWIGLNDRNSEGTFEWTSGEPVSYTHWNSGEPNNGGVGGFDEDAVHMWHPGYCCGPASYWNDRPVVGEFTDSTPVHGVIEVVPEPALGGLVVGCGILLVSLTRRGFGTLRVRPIR